ncbi:hypothetical protein FQA39_LY10078 [Lamprigera yunnana]|nr:hypothetical protein FQA39_LY10078 [Lamprigera yunnana]
MDVKHIKTEIITDVKEPTANLFSEVKIEEEFKTECDSDTLLPENTFDCAAELYDIRPFSCNFCPKTFKDVDSFNKHNKRHTVDRPFKCSTCGKKFSTKTHLNHHKLVHVSDKPYKCYNCDRTYSTKRYLELHIMDHTGIKPVQCTLCFKNFKTKYHLTGHMKTHTNERPFKCSVCNKYFKQKQHLNAHMKMHTNERPYSCNICAKAYRDKKTLINHNKVHTGERPFKCEYCDFRTTRKDALTGHIRTHTGEKPFKCYICNKAFIQSGVFKVHLRTHTGDKPFSCSICDRKFISKPNLRLHLDTHKGIKKFKCEVCEKAFGRSSNLRTHMRSHEKVKIKRFQCDACNKLFSTNAILRQHYYRIHTNVRMFKCELCDGRFPFQNEVKRHMITHTKEKAHECDLCKRRFAFKHSLTIHLRIHNNIKPYKCELCGEAFVVGARLKLHLLSKHNIETFQEVEEVFCVKAEDEMEMEETITFSEIKVEEFSYPDSSMKSSLDKLSLSNGSLGDVADLPWPSYRQFFKCVEVNGKNLKARCKLCLPNLKNFSCSVNACSNLRKHLSVSKNSNKHITLEQVNIDSRKAHPTHLPMLDSRAEAARKRKFASLDESSNQIKQIKTQEDMKEPKLAQDLIDNLVTNFVIDTFQPFSICDVSTKEGAAFEKLVQGLRMLPIGGTVVDAEMLQARLELLWHDTKNAIIELMSEVSAVSLTVDYWMVSKR